MIIPDTLNRKIPITPYHAVKQTASLEQFHFRILETEMPDQFEMSIWITNTPDPLVGQAHIENRRDLENLHPRPVETEKRIQT